MIATVVTPALVFNPGAESKWITSAAATAAKTDKSNNDLKRIIFKTRVPSSIVGVAQGPGQVT